MAEPRLCPDCVGSRVVVRRFVRGETGPSGGPAMTDLLGTLTAWESGSLTLVREDGTEVSVPLDDVVSGKPIPPRPPRRGR